MVCMKLHNLCLDRRVEVPSRRFVEDIREHDEWVVFDNARENDTDLRGRSSGERRRELTAKLQSLGIVRPLHASMNSRCNP
jgi:ATP-dependent DNA ligase